MNETTSEPHEPDEDVILTVENLLQRFRDAVERLPQLAPPRGVP